MKRLALLAAHWGVGLLPGPTGTYGSAVAAVLFYLLAQAMGGQVIWLFWPILIGGIWAAHMAEKTYGRDAGQIVVDEVAGQWLTLLFFYQAWWAYPAGFLLFRACDIIKPWPAKELEKLPGGLGVMADDIMAGLQAGACLWVLSLIIG